MATPNLGIIVYIWGNGNSISNNNWSENIDADSGNTGSGCCHNASSCSSHIPPNSWAGRYLPDKGIYISSDPNVIGQQIQDIKTMGCGFVALSYWNVSEKPQVKPAYAAWADYLISIGETQLKVCPYYEDATHKSQSVIEADIDSILNVTGNNIYKINNKPVIFAYGPSTDSTYLAKWNSIRQRKGIYLIQKKNSVNDHSLADLYHSYEPANRYATAGNDCDAWSPGFWRYHCDKRLERYDISGNWTQCEQDIIQLKNSTATLKLIETYNEWQEDSGIEPARLINHLEGSAGQPSPAFTSAALSYDTKYIDLIAKHFGEGCNFPIVSLRIEIG